MSYFRYIFCCIAFCIKTVKAEGTLTGQQALHWVPA